MNKPDMAALVDWLQRHRWIWSAAGVLILWLLLSLMTNRFSLSSLSGVAVSSSFLVLVALGQTAVVTTGRGNIDLSIASVMTLSAYIGLIVIGGADSRLPLGVLAALALGLAVGAVNAALVVLARIPAIIATLATGYVLATATLLANGIIPGFAIAPALRTVATGRVADMPIMVIIALAAVVAAAFLFGGSAYGRQLSAVGQNMRAARLAGVRTGRVVSGAFLLSSVLSSLTGLVLGAYVGGAFLEMGQPYRLQSIGAVVLGGTLIFGGAATAWGTLFGSLLLVLIVTTMQIAGLPPGTQDMVQGVVIIAVLALAGGTAVRRRRIAAK
ncbi:ABC transporter permease [Labrys monachus]|uniref:Autoinducer 2 import system permease protein LsrC n=1 Tax=Labrys monachus TaxID=217067 RepID=A0ABU0F7E5_9HYPH|nr:ABC transporter permease [Labrys monachus]MDQ0390537.1 ribose transport system permease protein [Labrys monachus]